MVEVLGLAIDRIAEDGWEFITICKTDVADFHKRIRLDFSADLTHAGA